MPVVSASTQYTVEEYLTEREMSALPVLLVEGDDDSIVFQLLIDEIIRYEAEIFSELSTLLAELHIDTAALIRSPDDVVLGNREKVEYVCRIADAEDFASRLVGFADREFREFRVDTSIVDNLEGHNQIGRLLWSRGHSIENYFFEWGILRDQLRDYAVNTRFPVQEVLALFEASFDDLLQHGCAISIVANENNLLKPAVASLNPDVFNFDNEKIVVDVEKWNASMKKKQLDEGRRHILIEGFNQYIHIATVSMKPTTRWACHGHIGMRLLWCAFQACVHFVANKYNFQNSHRAITLPNERDRLKAFSSAWIKNKLPLWNKREESPLRCFDQLLETPIYT